MAAPCRTLLHPLRPLFATTMGIDDTASAI
jgi:hypothetical protein